MADQILENRVVAALLTNAPGNDAGVDAKALRVDPHRLLGQREARQALVPLRLRYKAIERERIGDMTRKELYQIVDKRIIDRFKPSQNQNRTMAEVNESIRRNRIVPPPGAKSVVEMLREDRDA